MYSINVAVLFATRIHSNSVHLLPKCPAWIPLLYHVSSCRQSALRFKKVFLKATLLKRERIKHAVFVRYAKLLSPVQQTRDDVLIIALTFRNFVPRLELLALLWDFLGIKGFLRDFQKSMKMCKMNYFSLFWKSYLVLFLTFITALRFYAAPLV